jgi:hypothetical protein
MGVRPQFGSARRQGPAASAKVATAALLDPLPTNVALLLRNPQRRQRRGTTAGAQRMVSS